MYSSRRPHVSHTTATNDQESGLHKMRILLPLESNKSPVFVMLNSLGGNPFLNEERDAIISEWEPVGSIPFSFLYSTNLAESILIIL